MSPLACMHCGKSFSTISNCQRHMREVCILKPKNDRDFECCDCGAKFIRKSVLARHIKMRHIHLRDFECGCCPKKFAEKSDLLRHMDRMHKRLRKSLPKVPHCEKCKKSFSSNSSLKIHLITFHNDQDPVERMTCPECNKEFGSEFYLERHIKRIHRSERQKFFVCFHCSKKFRGKEDIRIHIRNIHLLRKHHSEDRKASTYKCLKCDDHFDAASLIQDHYRNEHDIRFQYEDLQFESIEEFEKWKLRMNQSTATQMKVDKKWEATDYSAIKYICHRSGCQNFLYKHRKSSVKETRSKKLGGYCPMEILVKIRKDSGICCATFQKTHVGHLTCIEDELRYTGKNQYKRKKLGRETRAITDVSENTILAEQESKNDEPVFIEMNILSDNEMEHFRERLKNQPVDVQSYVAVFKPVEDKDVTFNEENELIHSDVTGVYLSDKIVEISRQKDEQQLDDDFDFLSIEDIEVYEEIDFNNETESSSPRATTEYNSSNGPEEESENHYQTSTHVQMLSSTEVTDDDVNLVVEEFRRSLSRVRSKAELVSVQKTFVEPVEPFLVTRALNNENSSAGF